MQPVTNGLLCLHYLDEFYVLLCDLQFWQIRFGKISASTRQDLQLVADLCNDYDQLILMTQSQYSSLLISSMSHAVQ